MSKVIPWVLLVAALVGGVWYAATTRAQYRAARAVLTAENDSLRSIAAKRDTLYIPIKAKVKPARVATDSVLATLPPDLLPPVKVKLDAERSACDLVIQTCEQRVADRDALIANLNKQIKLERKSKPFLVRLGKPVGVFLGGMLVGKTLLK